MATAKKTATRRAATSTDEKDPAAAAAAAAAAAMGGNDDDEGELDEGDSATVTMLEVLVERDQMSKVPQQIFEYELEVLQRIFGEDRVEVIEDSEREVEVDNLDPDQQYQKLLAKYRQNEEAVTAAFPKGPATMARKLGLTAPARRDGATQAGVLGGSMVIDHSQQGSAQVARAQAVIRPANPKAKK